MYRRTGTYTIGNHVVFNSCVKKKKNCNIAGIWNYSVPPNVCDSTKRLILFFVILLSGVNCISKGRDAHRYNMAGFSVSQWRRCHIGFCSG